MRTFLDILDVLTYAEHFPLCIEASMHSSVYNSTSKCIMHAYASHLMISVWLPQMDMHAFPSILDAFTYTEHQPFLFRD